MKKYEGEEKGRMERAYSAEQTQAIRHLNGPCMVIAGPGAGKTTVITARIRCLVREYGIDPEAILVITFTRAAAAEMESRYRMLTQCGPGGAGGAGQRATEGASGVTFGTFHSVFFQILRREYGLNADSLMTEHERLLLLQEVVRRACPGTDADMSFLSGLLSELSNIRNNRLDPEKSTFGGGRVSVPEILSRYEAELQRTGRLDFDDMLVLTLRLFHGHPEVLERWRRQYSYILVDEFQDVNSVQYELVRLLALPGNNLFIVGDDDQSIYRFRGARPEIMLGFPKDYRSCMTVRLSTNYRSEPEIVRAAASVIGHNRARFEKKLRAQKTGAGIVRVRRFPDETGEYEALLSDISAELKAGTPAEQIAILVRTGYGAAPIVRALVAAGIPFQTGEQVPNLFRQAVCRPVFGYLNYAIGDRSRDNFLKFMNCPNHYIRRSELAPEIDLTALSSRLSRDPERQWMGERLRFFDRQLTLLSRLKTPYAMINYVRKGLEYDAWVLSEERERSRKQGMTPGGGPAGSLNGSLNGTLNGALNGTLNGNPGGALSGEQSESRRVLDELQESARPYDTVAAWYEYIAAYTREMDAKAQERGADRTGRIAVATMHAAKGLEYECVFIPDVNERVIPHEKAKLAEEIEEERRLFYVAMTRAVRRLELMAPAEYCGRRRSDSRFLEELED